MMTELVGVAILVAVALQRVAELILDRKNTAVLLAEGAVEHGAKHYPLFILLHGSWLIGILIWLLVIPSAVSWLWIGSYIFLQGGRLWVIYTLGRYWTTRIISIPSQPLVSKGPYKFLQHPNYWIVTMEIAVLPLAFGAWPIALFYSILNGALLYHRIGVENAALKDRRDITV